MSINKKHTLLLCMIAALGLFLEMGCASKKYVKQQIDPVSGRVDELTEVTKRNENAIKDVDSRAEGSCCKTPSSPRPSQPGMPGIPTSNLL